MSTRRTIFAAAALAVILAGCGSSGSPHAASSRSSAVTVHYELDGTAPLGADITYQTPTGSAQQQGVSLPLTTKAGVPYLAFVFSPGGFVYFSAQNAGESGSVTCRITEDGRTISENTATGDFAIATCSGHA